MMKGITGVLRRLIIDGVSLIATATLTLAGLWGLIQIEASLFSLIIYALLMMPALFSTATYFGRDVNKVTHRFIA